MNKKRQKLFWFIIIFVILAVGAAVLLSRFLGRTKFNDGKASGNTGGNYFNNGLFCEYDGTVYFSNPYDDYSLYSMTPEGTQARQLSKDTVSFINADEHYLYYVRDNADHTSAFSFIQVDTNSLCRVTHSGKQTLLLDEDPSLYAALCGNYIYYIHYDEDTASTLYKVKIDGTEKKKLNNSPLLLAPSGDGSLCYNGLDLNHNIWLWNPASDTSALLYEGSCWNPTMDDSFVYFMDCENDYHLTKVQKSSGEKTDISGCRVDCYNIYGDYAYYQKNEDKEDNYGLYQKALDGSSKEELIADGIYCDINVTSRYVYFRDFKNPDVFYQTPVTGEIEVTELKIENAR